MTQRGEDDSQPVTRKPAPAQYVLAGVVLAFAVAVLCRSALTDAGLQQSAAFYVGIPAIVALIVVFSAPGRSAVGIVMKVITILLLLSMMLLGEGFVCVIFAAPIFYLFGGLVTVVAEKIVGAVRKDDGARVFAVPASILAATVVLTSLEGVVPATTLPGATTVSAHRIVDADMTAVAAAWQAPMTFDDAPTGVLSWGFPRPISDSGGPFAVGAHRTVTFSGAHHRPIFVSNHHWGEHTTELEFEVVQQTPTSVRLAVIGDTTPISSWLTWSVADIEWSAIDESHTDVSVELSYTRELAPAWYFGPVEEFVAERAAGYLIDSLDLR